MRRHLLQAGLLDLVRKRLARVALAAGLATIGMVSISSTPSAFANGPYFDGEVLMVGNNAPLRTCPSTSCRVILHMPASTGIAPGDGYVTIIEFVGYPIESGSFCSINWKGHLGWTGCWRLFVLV